ncbi:MAG: T9SS type A sorting domain-containing protein [Sphingobacteriales bacterium]|nr:MAG: T9SS type A sorting domain-containing protein [Sphingobacteriales bacterium]
MPQTNGPISVFVADIDNDGLDDIVSASVADNRIGWFKNEGGGNYSLIKIISNNAIGAYCVRATDLDNDGNLDIVFASKYDNKVAWHKNLGDGIFGLQNIIDAFALGAFFVDFADIDLDGDTDVISASKDDGQIVWYLNNGYGSFALGESMNINYLKNLSITDIDNDGDIDLIVADSYLRIYKNNGLGQFSIYQSIYLEAYECADMAFGDLDGNSKTDIVLSNIFFGVFQIFQNLSGNFGTLQTVLTDFIDPHAITVTDLTNDGWPDIVVSSNYTSMDHVIILIINAGGGIYNEPQIIAENMRNSHDITVADLNDDSTLDILVAATSNNKIAWLANDGFGNFSDQHIITFDTFASLYIHFADFDNDGIEDLLTSSYYDRFMAWFKNTGNGNFVSINRFAFNNNLIRSVSIADLDNDGDLDIATASEYDCTVEWHENDGSGSFNIKYVVDEKTYNSFTTITTGDINNDGNIDLVVSYFHQDKLVMYLNEGDGIFSDEIIIATYANAKRTLILEDFNNDGLVDILTCSDIDNSISWYMNQGGGNFSNELYILSATMVYKVSAADLDNDGDLDIIYPAYQNNNVKWIENDGTGNFIQHHYVSGNSPFARAAIAADFDNDGWKDVLVGSGFNGGNPTSKVSWFRNLGGGTFGSQQLLNLTQESPDAVYAVDIDTDGDLDALSSSGLSLNILSYINQLYLPVSINTLPNALAFPLIITPNPTRNSATLTYHSHQSQPITLTLYDLTGRLLFEENLQPTIGTNNYILDILPYPQGLYVVTLNNGIEVVSGKVVKE